LAEVDEQNVVGAASDVEKPEGGADLFAMQAVAVGGAVARLDGELVGGLDDFVFREAAVAVVDEDLCVGETVLLRGILATELIGCGAGAGDYVGAYGTALGFVGVEKLWRGFAAKDERHLPCEVVGILNAGVHALTAGGGMDVGSVAGQEAAVFPIVRCKAHADAEV
jgi:hypothetical protein